MMISSNEICTYIGVKLFHAHLVKRQLKQPPNTQCSKIIKKIVLVLMVAWLLQRLKSTIQNIFGFDANRATSLNCTFLQILEPCETSATIAEATIEVLRGPAYGHELQALFGTFHKKSSYLAQYQTAHFSLRSLDQMWTTPIKCPVKYMDEEKLWAYRSISK